MNSRQVLQKLGDLAGRDLFTGKPPTCDKKDVFECILDESRKPIDEWITDPRRRALAHDLAGVVADYMKIDPQIVRFAPQDPFIVITSGIPPDAKEENITFDLEQILLIDITDDDLMVLVKMTLTETLDYLLDRAPLYPFLKMDISEIQEVSLSNDGIITNTLEDVICKDLDRFLHLHLGQPPNFLKKLGRLPEKKDTSAGNFCFIRKYMEKRYGLENMFTSKFLGIIPVEWMCLIGLICAIILPIVMYTEGYYRPIAVAELFVPMMLLMLLFLVIIVCLSPFRWEGIKTITDLARLIKKEAKQKEFMNSSSVR